jgi:O-antigen ligase
MTDVAPRPATGRVFDRARLMRLADWLTVAVVASLPWSTSISSALVAVWLLVLLPTLDLTSLRRTLALPAAALPVALGAAAVIGMLWSEAAFAEQLAGVRPFLRLLIIVLVLMHFQRSDRGIWVIYGFLGSCTVLLLISWVTALWPSLAWPSRGGPGIPVKDYLIQSGEFVICAFAFAHLSLDAWREGRRRHAVVFAGLTLAFLANITFVAVGRGTLVTAAVLVVVYGAQRFGWRGGVAAVVAGALLAALAWTASPHLRGRVLSTLSEVQDYRGNNSATSAGLRLEFWRKSAVFIADAPVIGHGTGSTAEMFRRAAQPKDELSAAVTSNPHNQTLTIGIQLGFLGIALLYAMWIAHLWLFRAEGFVAWLGFGIVVQSVVSCLFNSFLFEFTLGWLYLFAVGVLGGMVLRQRNMTPAPRRMIHSA